MQTVQDTMFLKSDVSEYNFSTELAVILAGFLALLLTFLETLLGSIFEEYFSIDLQQRIFFSYTKPYKANTSLSASMLHRYERLFDDRDRNRVRLGKI